MKNIILAAAIILASTCVGIAQNTEKVLKMGKWYANAELGSKTITLTKSAPSKWVFDLELISDIVIKYGKVAKEDLVDNAGELIKAGNYYSDSQYLYKVTGDVFQITFQPKSWNYTVKSLKNGDLLLELPETTNKSRN